MEKWCSGVKKTTQEPCQFKHMLSVLPVFTGKNLRFPIYVYNMVFGCLFNVFQETRKRNNFQFQDT